MTEKEMNKEISIKSFKRFIKEKNELVEFLEKIKNLEDPRREKFGGVTGKYSDLWEQANFSERQGLVEIEDFKYKLTEDGKELIREPEKELEELFGEYLGKRHKKLFRETLGENGINPIKLWRTKGGDKGYKYVTADKLFNSFNDLNQVITTFCDQRVLRKGGFKTNVGTRRSTIADFVIKLLEGEGKFLKSESERLYYFNKLNNKIYEFGEGTSRELENYIYEKIGISKGSNIGKVVLDELEEYIKANGKEVEVLDYFRFNWEEKKLYVYDRDKHYYILNGEEIKRKPNGTNGLFFKPQRAGDPFEYIEEGERDLEDEIVGEIGEMEGYLDRVMFNRPNLDYQGSLSPKDQRKLLKFYLYAFPFGDYFTVKPILNIVGEKGSTKTTTTKLIGKFLMEYNFKAGQLPRKERDYLVKVSSRPIVFIDNMSKTPDWFEDTACRTSTGQEIAEREYYTNYEMVVREPHTFQVVNGRNPEYDREDYIDRSFIIFTKRLDNRKFISEEKLFKPLKNKRDELWSIYLDNLNKILAEWKEGIPESKSIGYRMVSVNECFYFINEALDMLVEEEFDKFLKDLDMGRSRFVLEDEGIFRALKIYKERLSEGEYHTAKKLYDLLEPICKEELGWEGYYKSPMSLAKKFTNVEKELKNLIGFDINRREGKPNTYMVPKPRLSTKIKAKGEENDYKIAKPKLITELEAEGYDKEKILKILDKMEEEGLVSEPKESVLEFQR